MKQLLIPVLALLAITPAVEAQRHRAVRTPAPQCSFGLSVAYADPVPSAGMSRGRIVVTPSSAGCTSWNAYSPVDWIFFESAPAGEAAVTVRENASSSSRTATVRVAGIDLTVTQLGSTVITPPVPDTNLVKNGTFATNVDHWGWMPEVFNGNGSGVQQWSTLDANGSPSSGSLQLRSTDWSPNTPGMQALHCVGGIEPNAIYRIRVAYRAGVPAQGGGAIKVLLSQKPDCSGPYDPQLATQLVPIEQLLEGNGTAWRRDLNKDTFRTTFETTAILIAFGSKAKTSTPFDLFVDDVVLEKQ